MKKVLQIIGMIREITSLGLIVIILNNMINKIFLYDNATNQIELNVPEILLTKEFAKLMENERDIS